MVADDLQLTKSHLLRRLLEKRIEQLETEKSTLKIEVTALEEQLERQRRHPSSGRAMEDITVDVMKTIRAIGITARRETSFVLGAAAHEQSRLTLEMEALRKEGERLRRMLDETLASIQAIYDQVEDRTDSVLREAQLRQEQLSEEVDKLRRARQMPHTTLAQKRQAAFKLQEKAQEEEMRVASVLQATRDELMTEVKPLWQVSQTLKVALSHLNQRAQVLNDFSYLGAAQALRGKQSASAFFADLMTAPRPALAMASTAAASQVTAANPVIVGGTASPSPLSNPLQPVLNLFKELPVERARALKRLAMVPLITLALSTSASPKERIQLDKTATDESPEQEIARITMRHLVKEFNYALKNNRLPVGGQIHTIPQGLAGTTKILDTSAKVSPRADAAFKMMPSIDQKKQMASAVAKARADYQTTVETASTTGNAEENNSDDAAVKANAGSTVESNPSNDEVVAAAAAVPSAAEQPASPEQPPSNYTIQRGDTLSRIARRFDRSVDSILSTNPELRSNPHSLQVGQSVLIPPVDGVVHTVEQGETLAAIASTYGVSMQKILNYDGNQLANGGAVLSVGQKLVVPGGRLPEISAQRSASAEPAVQPNHQSSSASQASQARVRAVGAFIWPLQGRITQNPSRWHMALDIAAPHGRPIIAADGGRVVYAGWDSSGYGYRVTIDHGNGYRTLYAHLSAFNVSAGGYVQRGAVIGYVGSTGYSTGPHLHFEVIRGGVRQNPWNYLR